MLRSFLVAALVISSCFDPAAANDDFSVIPMQLRLAYAGPHGMMVSWNTYSQLPRPTVHYGLSPTALVHKASSHVSITYNTSITFNNHVKITGLKPNTRYYYLPEHSNLSTPYAFTTSRPAGDHTPYTIAYVADMGLMGPDGLTTHTGKGAANPLGPHDKNTIQSLKKNIPGTDFLWHSGDIGYADQWLKEEFQDFLPNTTIADGYKVYESLQNQYYDELVPITSIKPYMVGPGNHEANCNDGGITDPNTHIFYNYTICMPGQTNFTGYINHFRMPSIESRGTGNFWYSFDHGMVHYIQLDTETDLGHGLIGPSEPGGPDNQDSGPFGSYMDAQINWLRADLAAIDRKKTPWVVAAGHRAWYISAQNGTSNVCENCRKEFEPLFLSFSVDLYLSGHVHFYERNAPVRYTDTDPNELNNPSAPWYITNGAAGHYDGLSTYVTPIQNYSRYVQDTAYGWSRLTFHNCTHLTHEFVASANGTVLDKATLFKDRAC
ncbi:hypothetical protein APHAL10511_005496 [Amanita phalloides]|nr:hypothetical protein APHAL10511_005496 [Amanita phalloides]